MSFDWGEIWGHMGWVARAVLATLFIMSVWAATIVSERFLRFRAARAESLRFGEEASKLFQSRLFADVVTAGARYPRSPLATVVVSAVNEHQEGLKAHEAGATYDIVEAAERAVDRTVEMELSRLRRGLGGLASISSSSPFVGLFGTTFGIINSFRAIGVSGQGDLATVAPGIAEALVTTAFGILVALPAVWFFNYFMARVDVFGVDLRHAGSEALDFIIKNMGRRDAEKTA
ncbi:MAG: MotA/TolQ/ExbB proton channel family protein [Deltaproteobacteria bacterium]|nr:MotA/TolQ/ExbB proton channel family protein [Deltaproteobacteria bacterium]